MKKTIVYSLLFILSIVSVSAGSWVFCDIDGDTDIDFDDMRMGGTVRQWYIDRDMRFDLTQNGIVDLADLAYYGMHVGNEGWCQETFWKYFKPAISIKPQSQNDCSCGGGLSERGMGYYLFGDRDYFNNHQSIFPGLDDRYVTVEKYNSLADEVDELKCELRYGPGFSWKKSDCIMQNRANRYGTTETLNGKVFTPQ